MDNIGLAQYQNGGGGFGSSSQEDLQNLFKALAAGQITGRDTNNLLTASGAPLKVESLEKTLKVYQFKETDMVLWQSIPKLPAYNTVEEYLRLISYGQERGGFNLEGELPDEEDSVYQRKAELVKFLGNTRSVTHPMTLVNTVAGFGGAIQKEIKNGTLWVLRKANRAIALGDEALVPVEFNGIYKQHRELYPTPQLYYNSPVVIDCRGAKITDVLINEGVRRVVDSFGAIDTLFSSANVINGFVSTLYANKMYVVPGTSGLGGNMNSVGMRISEFQSQFGDIKLKFDKFLTKQAGKAITASATSTKSPSVPTLSASPVSVPIDALGVFAAADAGDYLYAVSASNRYGESTLLDMGTAVTAVAGGSVDMKFLDGGGAVPATYYTVYRATKGQTTAATATYYPIFNVSTTELSAGYDNAASTFVRDRNRILTNCDQAFMLENNEEIWSFKQLAPLMKMDLAQTAPAYRFMVLLYGTPMLYQPQKMIRFINIG